ncbi:uncharacterized protein LOC114323184 isoform X1 [Camellia sinensis]|uniref:uncharacterized protein LOC114323184 isoform X1 n=1 Tax=Camellia sinensis TaxID=4442 RepID=UPI001036C085|nr:uncharacterized protein LOC114323184 isoform X1 [Camellia sinensis]
MLFFNSYWSPTIAGDTTPNPLLPSSSSLFLPLSLHHPNLHQQWQRRPNEWSHCKMKNLKEESGIFDLSWYISSKRANQKLEVDPSMENEEALGTDGMDGFLSNLANAIPGIDEAMSFAEMLNYLFQIDITRHFQMDGDLRQTVQFLEERNANVVIRDKHDLNVIRVREDWVKKYMDLKKINTIRLL